jgi:hypothetical protein
LCIKSPAIKGPCRIRRSRGVVAPVIISQQIVIIGESAYRGQVIKIGDRSGAIMDFRIGGVFSADRAINFITADTALCGRRTWRPGEADAIAARLDVKQGGGSGGCGMLYPASKFRFALPKSS